MLQYNTDRAGTAALEATGAVRVNICGGEGWHGLPFVDSTRKLLSMISLHSGTGVLTHQGYL